MDSHQIQIVPITLPRNIVCKPLNIFLAQLGNDVNRIGRIKDPEEKWKIVKKTILFVNHNQRADSFLIFPELSIPSSKVAEFIHHFVKEFEHKTIVITGIEIITLNACMDLANKIGAQNKDELNAMLSKFSADQPINICLVLLPSNEKEYQIFLQPKIIHSKFEGNIDGLKNLATSTFIYHFIYSSVSFVVVLCSDLFRRPPGSLKRIIDNIDYQILKSTHKTLDFIFNIQHNPSPEADEFIHGLRRLFDDGYGNHKSLCTIFLNKMGQNYDKDWGSKILFHESIPVPYTQPIRTIDAPTKGYELPSGNRLIEFVLDRMPRFLEQRSDPIPFHIVSYSYIGKQWKRSKYDNIKYITPSHKIGIGDFRSYRQLAKKISLLGEFEEAILWADRALKEWKYQKEYVEAAQIAHFIGTQYRHMGEFRKSLKYYADAESFIYQRKENTFETQLLEWRIKASKLIIGDYLIDGNCIEAEKNFSLIETDANKYIQENDWLSDRDRELLNIYLIHSCRQRAEMMRVVGKYRGALDLFKKTYYNYSYIYSEEKAYAALGQAECLRMLYRYPEAIEKYDEVSQFCEKQGVKRLLIRQLRGIIELKRAHGIDFKYEINKLSGLCQTIKNRFLLLYFYLISGAATLSKDPLISKSNFEKALELSMVDGKKLNIEYAHALFGIGETKRILNQDGWHSYYNDAYQIYKRKNSYLGPDTYVFVDIG